MLFRSGHLWGKLCCLSVCGYVEVASSAVYESRLPRDECCNRETYCLSFDLLVYLTFSLICTVKLGKGRVSLQPIRMVCSAVMSLVCDVISDMVSGTRVQNGSESRVSK